MEQSKLVVVYDRCVECADRQLKRTAHLINPSYTLETCSVLLRVAHAYICKAFLYARLQNVRFRDLNVRGVWSDALALVVRGRSNGRHSGGRVRTVRAPSDREVLFQW
jgi:hypothetical protein